MFRILASRILTPRPNPALRYHTTPTLNMVSTTSPLQLLQLLPNSLSSRQSAQTQFTPEDWYIVEASPGGVDKELVNRITGATTWGAPPGADAAGLLRIPGADKYWGSLQEAERFVRESVAEAPTEGRAAGAGEGNA